MSFETKDSGKRVEFASGMVRDVQDGKTLYHLVFDGPMFERWAALLTRGAQKYSERNWMKAEGEEELERAIASATRHFIQWRRGDTDEDHAAAVIFNVNLVEYVKGKLANEPLTFNGVPIQWVSTLGAGPVVEDAERGHARETQERFNRASEETFAAHAATTFEVASKPPVDLDKCGTLDGVTPLPTLGVDEADCPDYSVVSVKSVDPTQQHLADALTLACNYYISKPEGRDKLTPSLLDEFRRRRHEAQSSLWKTLEEQAWAAPVGTYFETLPAPAKPSLWQRVKAWVRSILPARSAYDDCAW